MAFLGLARSRLPACSRGLNRGVHDYVRGVADRVPYKVHLKSPKVVGFVTSRGNREYMEDAADVRALEIDPAELERSLPPKAEWNPQDAGDGELARQVEYFAIFDGHGGKAVSSFLQTNLAQIIETVTPSDVEPTVRATVEAGGYFKRWRGGALKRWTEWANDRKADAGSESLTLDERLTLAFLKADQEVKATVDNGAQRCGSTASVVLLQSLDAPGQPHWAAQRVSLTVAHTGDTRVLLCNSKTGEVTALTDKHHAESRTEATRLRRLGTADGGGMITDSFGESRWMGAVENTRGFGDFEWKPLGVTAEPEITHKLLDGKENAYLVLVTDGLTNMMSDQEIVDLARQASDPTRAAKNIVHFGEDLGAQDNCTCIVVPLAGWGHVGGEDTTEPRREYRRRQARMYNGRMQRM